MKFSIPFFFQHLKIILDEIIKTSKERVAMQQKTSIMIAALFGPALFALPLIIASAFSDVSQTHKLLVNLLLVSSLMLSTYLFNNIQKKYIHDGFSESLPINNVHKFFISFAFTIATNSVFVVLILSALAVNHFTEASGSSNHIQAYTLIYFGILLCFRHFSVYLNISIIPLGMLFFVTGYLILISNWLLFFLAFISIMTYRLYLQSLYWPKKWKITSFIYFLIRTSAFLWLSIFFGFSIFIFVLFELDSILIVFLIGCITTISFGYTIHWAINFTKTQAKHVKYMPFSNRVLSYNLAIFIIVVCTTNLAFNILSNIFLIDETDGIFIPFQQLALCLGIISSFYKDELRLPIQTAIFLIYLMIIY